ncbi:hypothetical protein [Armatimonas sp.]|uniref:hypothetical protein n=1 Tax=Armatimonas sp. TaxID=1872638 RepID=UPI00286C09B8|nr:hypothetical protein [Armatimonas sp.]
MDALYKQRDKIHSHKVYHKKIGRQIADIDEIEAAFPSESLSEGELSDYLRPRFLESQS